MTCTVLKVNPLTTHRDVMLSAGDDPYNPGYHPFWYARVLGIFHFMAWMEDDGEFTPIYLLWIHWLVLGSEPILTHPWFRPAPVFIILILFLIVSYSTLPFSSIYILSDFSVNLFSVLCFRSLSVFLCFDVLDLFYLLCNYCTILCNSFYLPIICWIPFMYSFRFNCLLLMETHK